MHRLLYQHDMTNNSPYVKTRGEKRGMKQKASGNVLPANDADRPNCESTGDSMAAKLDVIIVASWTLEVM